MAKSRLQLLFTGSCGAIYSNSYNNGEANSYVLVHIYTIFYVQRLGPFYQKLRVLLRK